MGDEVIKDKFVTTKDEAMKAAVKGMKALQYYREAEMRAAEMSACFDYILSLPKSHWLNRWKIEKGKRRFLYFGWWRLKLSREIKNQEDSTND